MSRSIEPPPLLKYSFRNSKRRVYSGSNSLLMDPDVVEISPPIHHPSKLIKQKVVKAILRDVIDIDDDEDSADLVFIGENVGGSNKGKDVSDNIFCPPGMEQFGSANLPESNGYASVSHNINNVEGHNSDLSFDEDDYIDLFSEDYMEEDEYAILQAHFDNVDIPAGIEASIPWMPNFDQDLKKSVSSSSNPWSHTQSNAKNSHVTNLPQLSWAAEPSHPIQGTSVGSSSFQTKMDAIDYPSGIEMSSPQLLTQPVPGKKETTASQNGQGTLNLNLSLGVDSSKPLWFKGHSNSKKPAVFPGSSSHHYLLKPSEFMNIPPGSEPYWEKMKSAKKAHEKDILFHSSFFKSVEGSYNVPGMESANLTWKNPPNYNPSFVKVSGLNFPYYPFHGPQMFGNNMWGHNYAPSEKNETTADIPLVTISDEERDEILRKFRHFKQFDTVEDTSDHYYNNNSNSLKQNPKSWSKRIQEEWKILEKDLPDSIFVRVYESRMDLLRAVIIGAEGTPYHDGLFFFDVFFPSGYPNVPPQVHYHSGGLRLNPNLYHCGKVCLSLLNTWSGNKNEKWLPGVSTVLQVLVSIQGLILNTKPFFNEPGYARMSGSPSGEMRSVQYNEETFILSLRTMTYMIRRPPKV
ncbi:putative ubiquitin-conjugating enzyme E2 25 isoform X2 [Senna tora]|uniref:Putative ubiquitin-conjugating enzyme E2 25 isoform X2 n=1 Tax=Senna tora TaxID=362788 RepID=A0A834X2A8_9FABA|nr:putative ubiquitin-conjugating enzyme E2 25 isoform X2 [Senna tora]